MKGVFYINGRDAYEAWGITLDSSALSALMTPPPAKDYITGKSRLEHGTRYVTDSDKVKVNERSIALTFNLTAGTETEFFKRYGEFCEELRKGVLEIKTAYQPDTVYRTVYVSCSQFTQFMRGIAKFSLKLTEPDPTDRVERTIENKTEV